MNINNYTVFDVETANSKRDSICSIGYIRVENGEIIKSEEIFINPETNFDSFNIKVHGIIPQMVENEKTFPEVWNIIKPYFSDTTLVAHNAKSMDLCALVRMLDRYGIEIPQNDYICTLELARNFYSKEEIGSYKLNMLCAKFNIPLDHHHNALDDAKACYGLLNYFIKEFPLDVKPSVYYPNLCCDDTNCSAKLAGLYSEKTIAMQQLQMIVMDVIKDDIITIDEANSLLDWMNKHSDLDGFYPYDKIFNIISGVLSDGIISKNEEIELLEILEAYINPQTNKAKVNVTEKTICLSGDFDYGTKKEVEQYFISKGAKISNTVTRKIDILVLGECGNVAWKYGNYGTKYEKVQQLNEKGANILVYRENDIIGYLDDRINIDDSIIEICDNQTTKHKLFPNKVEFTKSESKKGKNIGNIVSLFVQIVEMGYPDVNAVSSITSVLRIPADNVFEINISSKSLSDFLVKCGFDEFASIIINTGENNEFVGSRFLFKNIDKKYFDCIEKSIDFSLKNYISSNSKFGCCSRYKDCSKQGECIHPNKLYSTVCEYQTHLKKGNIFYK